MTVVKEILFMQSEEVLKKKYFANHSITLQQALVYRKGNTILHWITSNSNKYFVLVKSLYCYGGLNCTVTHII